MLIHSPIQIGNNLLTLRKRAGLTQAEVAELSHLSDRTYADIERGSVNMRVDTLIKICESLNASPNDILTSPDDFSQKREEELFEEMKAQSRQNRETAAKLLEVYLASLKP